MRVLVACEESGKVRDAFTAKGHYAMSCDILPSATKGPHYQGDVRNVINDRWDMVIAFPPCTHLASSGARWFPQKRADGRQQEGIDFFMMFTRLYHVPRVVIENPIGIMSTEYRKPDQIIQPWMFGDPFTKSTCLWLKGLPKLQPTDIVSKGEMHVTKSGKKLPKWYNDAFGLPEEERSKLRSRTFDGIANALAEQYGSN